MMAMKRLSGNRGFKMYRAMIENDLRAELMASFDDLLGREYPLCHNRTEHSCSKLISGQLREGVLTAKDQTDVLREMQLHMLTKLTAQESHLMTVAGLYQQFPVPDQVSSAPCSLLNVLMNAQVSVSVLVCAKGAKRVCPNRAENATAAGKHCACEQMEVSAAEKRTHSYEVTSPVFPLDW